MPFYEYLCQACGQHHEAMQKMSEAPLRTCPQCGKPKLKRLISAPVFRLKGGGWYETDFKSDKEAKRNLHGEEAKADKADKAESADQKTEAAPAKSEAKAETKPDAKPEAKAEPTAASKSAAKSPSRKIATRSRKPARRTPRRR